MPASHVGDGPEAGGAIVAAKEPGGALALAPAAPKPNYNPTRKEKAADAVRREALVRASLEGMAPANLEDLVVSLTQKLHETGTLRRTL